MPKASPIRSTFNAGELSPLLDGRVDIAKYSNGCRVLENFIPTVQGPAVRRGGTRFVAEVKTSANRTWLARFEFSTAQAYILEFGNQYLRFYTNHGQLQTGTVTAYNGATAYAVGDLASSGGVNYYCIAATTGNAPPNATYWYPLTGTVYEIPTPWTTADLTDANDGTFRLSLAQTGDVLYIAHPSYPLQKLSRFSATKWTLGAVELLNGPFKTQNADRAKTVYASATTGSVTLTASSAIFTAAMVGSYVYLEPADLSTIKPWTAGEEFVLNPVNTKRRSDGKTYNCTTSGTPTAGKAWRTGPDKPIHTYGSAADGGGGGKVGTNIELEGLTWQFVDSGYGYAKITGFTSGTVVTATVMGDNPLPAGVVGSGNATFRWALGSFSGAEGYPNRVTFFRERLTLAKDQTLYFSVAADFENFAAKDDSGQIVADRAIQATISSDQVNQVQWLAPAQQLLIGTAGTEFSCSENSTSEPFAPGNIKIEQETNEGSRAVTPLRVGNSVLAVQKSGRKLKELTFAIQSNGFQSQDLTVLAEHVTVGGIQQATWHKEPYLAVWAVRGDGQLLGFTYNKEQDTVGWHRHILGGSREDIIDTFARASTATYFDASGVLRTAAVDEPRYGYNPVTLDSLGLLVEPSSANSIYPSNFSSIGTVAGNNAWYETFATLDTTVNAAVAPDGTTTAALLAINAATSFNAMFYRTASTTAGTYAYSVFCKANSTDTLCRILLSGDAGVANTVRADFTLSGAGTASAASVSGTGVSAASPTIQAVGNGWYRCAIYATLTAPSNITALVYPGNVGAQTTASQTLVWGAQLEVGAFPTSYIPTTNAAVTRAADVVTYTSGDAEVESVCTISAPDRDRDELWVIVKRTINGTTKRYVEYLEREYRDGDTQASCYYVDSGATYSGAPATTISGLTWLEGQTVQVLTDGAAHPDRVVTSGAGLIAQVR